MTGRSNTSEASCLVLCRDLLTNTQCTELRKLIETGPLIWPDKYLLCAEVETWDRHHKRRLKDAKWKQGHIAGGSRAQFQDSIYGRLCQLTQVTLRSPVWLAHTIFSKIVEHERHLAEPVPLPYSVFCVDYEQAGIRRAKKWLAGETSMADRELRRHVIHKWIDSNDDSNDGPDSCSGQLRNADTAEQLSRWLQVCNPSWRRIDERTLSDIDLGTFRKAKHPLARELPEDELIRAVQTVNSNEFEARIKAELGDNFDDRALKETRAEHVRRARKAYIDSAKNDVWDEVHYHITMMQFALRGELFKAAYRVCSHFAGLPNLMRDGQPKALEAAAESVLGDTSTETMFRMRQFCQECYHSLPPPMRAFVQIDAELAADEFVDSPEGTQSEYVGHSTDETVWLWRYLGPNRELAPIALRSGFALDDKSDVVVAEYSDGSQLRAEDNEWIRRDISGEIIEWPECSKS